MQHLFVDEQLNIYTAEAARERLSETSDAEFVEEGVGVPRVSKSRWAIAQSYEQRTWMEAGAHSADDRNEEHARNFNDYQLLAGRSFQRAVELGCGPFTNLRVLGRLADIKRCVLVDPLLDSYLAHRHCRYRHGKVVLQNSRLHGVLEDGRALRMIRRMLRLTVPGSLEEGIPVERRLACPVEEMPECDTFDLVVMINVIEHCYDSEAALKAVVRLCRRGTVFVFHDRLYDAATAGQAARARFDAGHPLRVGSHILERFLKEHFRPLMDERVDVHDSVADLDLTETGVYFIGEYR